MTTAPPYALFLATLLAQGPWVSLRTIRLPPAQGPRQGGHGEGPALNVLALGDSIVAGVGVTSTSLALPARFAQALAPLLSRHVQWHALGLNGQRSRGLVESLTAAGALAPTPDLVLISNGINDVTRPGRPALVLAQLKDALNAVQQQFPASVIMQLGLPPLGRFPALPSPLRQLLGGRAAAIDAALGDWVRTREGIYHLPFDEPANPEDFAQDGYHPNADGVQRWAGHLATRVRTEIFELATPAS